jgi:NAD(P)-dependent dehydrogenase (short-subunit alcohol dehydrogenase family)
MSPSMHQNRLAVVTGAGRGIGRAYAERLAADGARLVLADLESPDEAAGSITAAGGEATAVVSDVADPDSVAALAQRVADLGGADILVHNAGIYPMGPVSGISFEEWRKVFAVNLDSLFLLTQAFLPHMREQGWGRIVGVSSAMFHMGAPGSLHYVASKGGVIGFVRALAAEVGAEGVTVNAIAPGLIRSPGTSTGIHDELGLFEMVIEHQSIKRTGMPEDLAGVMSFLVSDDAGYMTGQTLVVDGGTARA